MNLTGIRDLIARNPSVERFIDTARRRDASRVVCVPATHPFLIAELASADEATLVVVTATGRDADDLADELSYVIPERRTEVFPSWETLPHERLSPSPDTVGRRLAVLRSLAHPEESSIDIVVTPIRALLQPIVSDIIGVEPVILDAGADIAHDDVVERLISLGYQRTELVERRGQLAVRGGIIDVFPPTEEHPVRLEFWGDHIEEMRLFSVADQRSLADEVTRVVAFPVSELLLTDSVRKRAGELAQAHPELSDIAARLAEGQTVEGMEALAPVLADGMTTLLDVVPRPTTIAMIDPERVHARAVDLVRTSEEFLEASWHNAAAGAATPIDLRASAYRTLDDVAAGTPNLPWWQFSPFGADSDLAIAAENVEAFRGDMNSALEFMKRRVSEKWCVVVVLAGHGSAERLVEECANESIPVQFVEELAEPPATGMVTIVVGHLSGSFEMDDLRLCVLAESTLLGASAATRDGTRLPSRRRRTIDPLALSSGDFVVHEQHGVGRYIEMVQRTVAGAVREYLVLEYASSKRGQPPDRLFVPMDQLDHITRYVGGEMPTVHRLGGSDWAKAKGRARKAVKEIAGELIRLYAARMSTQGYAFGSDSPWQHELEDAFAYVETADQLACIDEVKADMERSVPMDRVICGDVGYGKTEIAVRAAFKAVQDGKQVAVLVPTTLLVQQHFATFSQRYAPFPVKVAALSRFNTDKEVKQVIADLGTGVVDVVIGTHRLLTPDIKFKDLGLVIVDEEQRFGVEHKEHLKALRTNVDVLAMSATPIPRTLEMAVTGIREMSVIQTPPEERHPVLTYVGPYDDKQITAAINRELMRDGQVFFVHNRVASIDRVAANISELVPDARIAVAHGQMNESVLEQVILDFWEGSIDVLVCTTIIETGIDIPNANTLIVDRADMFGLSQLHQLRGRVGRSRERGYAYFLFQPDKPLTETAHERLATVAQHADLGSGMQIALKDLEIRGAGNLLGGEQSGHIADVGFDLYIRLVGKALAEYKGEAETENVDIKIELPVDAHIPHDYVAEERLRLEAYKRFAAAYEGVDVEAVVEELLDRYGPLPQPVERLVDVARLRVLAKKAGLDEIVLAGKAVRFHPVELPESRAMRLTRLYPGTMVKPAVRTILVPKPNAGFGESVDLVSWARELIEAILVEEAK